MRRLVEAATEQAISDGLLPVDAVYCDVYANTPALPIRGVTVDEIVTPKYTTTAEVLRSMGVNVKSK